MDSWYLWICFACMCDDADKIMCISHSTHQHQPKVCYENLPMRNFCRCTLYNIQLLVLYCATIQPSNRASSPCIDEYQFVVDPSICHSNYANNWQNFQTFNIGADIMMSNIQISKYQGKLHQIGPSRLIEPVSLIPVDPIVAFPLEN